MDNGQGNGSTPAAPFTAKPEYQHQEIGLTKREHFAAMAMQGMSSHPEFYGTSTAFAENIARDSVKLADALLKELSK